MDGVPYQVGSCGVLGACRRRAVATMIIRSLTAFAIALTTLSAAIGNSCAQAPDVKVQGPWAYTRQTTGAAEAVRDMATTSASEDGNVWLLVACSQDRQATVAIMDVQAFPYPVARRAKVALRIDAHARLNVLGLAISDKQISIEPTSSHDLLP